MKIITFIFLLLFSSASAENIKPLANSSIDQLLSDDNLNYEFIKSCVSIYSGLTELTRAKEPEIANQFFKSANFLYPYGILTLVKLKKISRPDAEKIFFKSVEKLTNEYINLMLENGKKNESFFKGSFLADDIYFCNEVASAIQTVVSKTKKN